MRLCLAALLCAACAAAPPVDKSGLPRVGRYTNTAQLDWMLGSYADVAARTADAQVREQACLGWERTVFDVQSFQVYTVHLRLSSDAAGLQAIRDGLAAVAARHPLPAVCRPIPEGPAGPKDEQAAAQAAAEAPPPGPEDVRSGQADSGQPQAITQPGQPQPQPPVPALTERQLLGELRAALHLRRDGSEGMGAVDEARLLELTRSDVPTIQLRARYHLLGRCQRLVEQIDAFPTAGGTCAGGGPGEPPRRGLRRLRDQLFRSWARKYTEPMSDIVIALATATSRDNPLVDGPRVSR